MNLFKSKKYSYGDGEEDHHGNHLGNGVGYGKSRGYRSIRSYHGSGNGAGSNGDTRGNGVGYDRNIFGPSYDTNRLLDTSLRTAISVSADLRSLVQAAALLSS